MNKFWKHFVSYWTEDKGLASLLAITAFIIFIVFPLQTVDIAGRIIITLFYTLLIVAGIASFFKQRQQVIVIIFAVFFLLTTWLSYFTPHGSYDMLNKICTILFVSTLTFLTLKRVFVDSRITYNRILGAILAFLLFGLIWASLYELVYMINPNSFNLSPAVNVNNSSSEFVYFSFVTLCTIGYGDITPIHPVARSLSLLEGVIGVMYPAVLIGRLVSQQLANKL